MPQCCSVPKCSNRKSGHRFPQDSVLRKAWLIAIRREKFVPTKHSRVCNEHFDKNDYVLPMDSVRDIPKPQLKKNAVPSVFEWTKAPTPGSLERRKRADRRHGNRLPGIPDKEDLELNQIGNLEGDSEPSSNSDQLNEVSAHQNNEGSHMADLDFQLEVMVESNETSCALINSDEISSETAVSDVNSGFYDSNNVTESVPNTNYSNEEEALAHCSGEQIKQTCTRVWKIADFKSKEKWEELQYYTGFDSFDQFMFIFNLLGPAVYHLNYYSSCTAICKSIQKSLSSEDQFFLTMVKLRRFCPNKELSYMFRIKDEYVYIIFITWINFLYCQLTEIDIWASNDVLTNLMKLKGKECDATIIIGCSEIKIGQPKNPLSQQQTYSTHKGCNTVKVLVGMSPTGALTFISEAFGGSISDRELFQKSGLLDKLSDKDIVLADSGFNIQDLLATKKVKVSIPEFVPAGNGQLRPAQLKRFKKVSSKQICIERIIGLTKTYKIMEGPIQCTLVPLVSRIVFVCFMMANFRSNIVM